MFTFIYRKLNKKSIKKIWNIIANARIFAIGKYIYITIIAGVAQLVERQPSKLNVASSNLVSRSKKILDASSRIF